MADFSAHSSYLLSQHNTRLSRQSDEGNININGGSGTSTYINNNSNSNSNMRSVENNNYMRNVFDGQDDYTNRSSSRAVMAASVMHSHQRRSPSCLNN